jgi:RNA polymerase sigma-70 factor (ECF subfamily)
MTSGARPWAEDFALVRRLVAGDASAFALLVDRYHGRLLRLAMTFVSDRAAAEDVVQDTWLGVMRGLETFEGRSALSTWIFRILTNRAKTRALRDARSLPFSALDSPDQEHEPAVDPARFQPNGAWADPPRRWDDDTPEKLLMKQEASTICRKRSRGFLQTSGRWSFCATSRGSARMRCVTSLRSARPINGYSCTAPARNSGARWRNLFGKVDGNAHL